MVCPLPRIELTEFCIWTLPLQLNDDDEEIGSPGSSSYHQPTTYRSLRERDMDILSKGRALLSETIPSPRFKRHTIRKEFDDIYSTTRPGPGRQSRLDYSYRPTTTTSATTSSGVDYTSYRPALTGPVYYGERASPVLETPPCLTAGVQSCDEVIIASPIYLDEDEDEVFVPPVQRKTHVHLDNNDDLGELTHYDYDHDIDDPVCLGRYSDRHVDDPADIEYGTLSDRVSEITRRYQNKEGLYGDVDYSTELYPRYYSTSSVTSRSMDLDENYQPTGRHLRSMSDIERKYRRATNRTRWEDDLDMFRRSELENDDPVSVLDRIKVKVGTTFPELSARHGVAHPSCPLPPTVHDSHLITGFAPITDCTAWNKHNQCVFVCVVSGCILPQFFSLG